MMVENNNAQQELIDMARQSLDDSPMYLDHIASMLCTSVDSFRSGDDTEGMNAFARGVSDLEQFIQLFNTLINVAKPDAATETDAFKDDLFDCIRDLEVAMNNQDIVGLSDSIDANLLKILPRWGGVAEELGGCFGA